MLIETESAPRTAGAAPSEPQLGGREWFQTAMQLTRLRIKEYLQFDAWLVHRVGAIVVSWLASVLIAIGQYRRGFNLLAQLHRGAFSPHTTARVEAFVETALKTQDPRFSSLLNDFVAHVLQSAGTANFFADPLRMLGTAVLVLKSPSPGQKGVIVIWYNHVFPLFARFFDLPRIADRYHLVLEPSWSGYCDLNLLAYTQVRAPVFVQAIEPNDIRFLSEISSNLITVPTAFNWWVDFRKLRPLPDVEKEFDVIMLAGWGSYKRHYSFFDALANLRRQGHRLRVLLVGYNVGWTKNTILQHAMYYGVRDQIELRENVPYRDINEQLNRARIHVLWSRREGVNRANIEAMFANLPCIIREGFNYGYEYPYLNAQTGRFASQRNLPRVLLDTISNIDQYSPREWVMKHMTCQQATAALARVVASSTGEPEEAWNDQVAVKVNELHSMRYLDESRRDCFQPDYEYVATKLRSIK